MGQPAHRQLRLLREKSGSACLADSDEPSHVVKAMKPESAASRQMSRFSLDATSTEQDIQQAVKAVLRAVELLRQ